ncbi:ribosome maturation factor RimP [Ekhidna sp.]|uniref:ribosome maturation factor RimP n=1 Tax=Ekhidna sp. TaxID=2608089 RepID=UPI0032981FAB
MENVVFLCKKVELTYMFSTFAYSYTKNTERGDSSPLFLFIENLEEEKKIRDLAEKAIEGFDDLFLVDIKVKGNSGNQKVLIFIDGDNGISIDQCSKISREIGNEIEEEDFIADKYTLEVSSPGLDFPIILHRQYVKNVGREIEVEMNSGEKAEGKLSDVTEETIVLIFNNESQSLKFEEIKQSKVKVSFK